jgi:hypothetical protein
MLNTVQACDDSVLHPQGGQPKTKPKLQKQNKKYKIIKQSQK